MGQDSLDGRGIKVASRDHDGQRSYVYTQYIGILLTYNFNATRSKYKELVQVIQKRVAYNS